MRGLPWKVTVDEIVEFYKNGDFTVKPEDVVIERQDGKVTGFGLAFLASVDDAEGAIDAANILKPALARGELGVRAVRERGAKR